MLTTSQSCNFSEQADYSYFYNFGMQGLQKDYWYAFDVDLSGMDESKKFNIYLETRYTGRCEDKELILKLELFSLDSIVGLTVQDNVKLSLYEKNDIPKGKGALNLFEVTETLCRDVPSGSHFTLFISTPLESTEGINSIGIVAREIK